MDHARALPPPLTVGARPAREEVGAIIAPTADSLLHAPPRATVSVLVVDDDPTIRGLVRRVLEHEGHAVREAPSGRGALALLQEGAPVEAVVTDLKMGDGSGGGSSPISPMSVPRCVRARS
jgi:PleD family two-component response regulator